MHGRITAISVGEIVEHGEARSSNVDFEQGAIAATAALLGRAVQRVVRIDEIGLGISSA